MSKRSDYVKAFVEDAMANPRKAFGGHGIPSTIINEIAAGREDVFKHLAILSWNSKYRTKYSAGLRASKDFKMFGYKNFANFNVKARANIEEFVAGLSEADQATFKNNKNILVIVMQQEAQIVEGVEQMINGASLMISFDRAIRADQKSVAGYYIMLVYSDSFANSSEAEKEPEVINDPAPAKQNQILAVKKSRKAKNIAKKLRAVNSRRAQLMGRSKQLGNQIAGYGMQDAWLKEVFGEDYAAGIEAMNSSNEQWNKDFNKAVKKATRNDKALIKAIAEIKKRNGGKNDASIRALLKNFDNADLATMIETGEPEKGSSKINARRRALNTELKKLTVEATGIMNMIESAKKSGDKKKVISLQQKLHRISTKIQNLRGQLGTYHKMSSDALAKKTAIFTKVNADIEKLIARGKNLSDAMETALDKAGVTEGEKELIKQQVVKKVAEGQIGQYAVQQAIQDHVDNPAAGISVQDMLDKGIL